MCLSASDHSALAAKLTSQQTCTKPPYLWTEALSVACCTGYKHLSSTGAPCQPSNAERMCRLETAAQLAQEKPPPVPGLRGRWELCAWHPRWLTPGGGAPPPSDGLPAPRSSRLQQPGHLHPHGPLLSAAPHISLAEMPAARLEPQAAVGRHQAGTCWCGPRLA